MAIFFALILAFALSIRPIDRFLLRFVQRLPGPRKLFSWTFTKNWRRYQAKRVRVEAGSLALDAPGPL